MLLSITSINILKYDKNCFSYGNIIIQTQLDPINKLHFIS